MSAAAIHLDNPDDQIGGRFGASVAWSDMDGDGFADLLVGAPGQSSGTAMGGAVFVFAGGLSGVVASSFTRLDNPDDQAGANFGASVAGVGDLDGDGFGDIVVGAHLQSPTATHEGSAFVYGGAAGGASSVPTVRLDNPDAQVGAQFGYSVAGAGDVNGDGFSDLLVGAPFLSSGADNEGNVFIYFGASAGLSTAPSARLDEPDNEADANFGVSVSAAGDLNGDGFTDIVVGAPGTGAAAAAGGEAFVYYGSSAGLGTTPNVRLTNPDGAGSLGHAVGSALDADGDGFDELMVASPAQSAGAPAEGNVFVYSGDAGGITAVPSLRLDNPDNMSSGRFGQSIGGLGDVNGNGLPDIVVGALGQSSGSMNGGSAFVFLGLASGLGETPAVRLDNPRDQELSGYGWSVVGAGHGL